MQRSTLINQPGINWFGKSDVLIQELRPSLYALAAICFSMRQFRDKIRDMSDPILPVLSNFSQVLTIFPKFLLLRPLETKVEATSLDDRSLWFYGLERIIAFPVSRLTSDRLMEHHLCFIIVFITSELYIAIISCPFQFQFTRIYFIKGSLINNDK